jgi:hypothetical protein
MKKIFIISLFLILLPAVSLADEFLEIEGWKPEGKMKINSQDDLWEYINGAAEQYLAYGFKLLRYRDFSKGDLLMTVDMYDMGSPLNAFGIYATERPGNVKPLPIGTEAVIIPPAYCLLLKDRFYIKAQMIRGEFDDKSGMKILNSIEASVKGSSNFPLELSLLPERDKISGSENYVKEKYMGLAELNNVIFAYYAGSEGNEYRCFLVIIPQGETAEEIWGRLSNKWTAAAHREPPVLHRDIPYEGKIGITLKGDKIFGVSGVSDTDEMFRCLDDMF